MSDGDYKRQLKTLQHRLVRLQQAYTRHGYSAVIVLEGWDAAGKGGLIRRIGWALDPRALDVWQIGAPTPRERGEHWLQRFWVRLPAQGTIAIFDRSWYGRVLVEGIEGLIDDEAWERAYREINDFEHGLAAEGIRIVKLFLDITPATQLRRFLKRYRDPAKRWKLTAEDIHNRSRWTQYERAYGDMAARCSTSWAPWVRIDANHKHRARVDAMREIVDALGDGVDMAPAQPPSVVREFVRGELGSAD